MLKLFLTVFITVFIAEIGDKTQLATFLYSAKAENSKWIVFAASALALVFASGIGVLAGTLVSKWLDPKTLGWIAGIGFLGVGAFTIYGAIKG